MPAHFHEDGSITLTGSGPNADKTLVLKKYDEAQYVAWLTENDPQVIEPPPEAKVVAALKDTGVIDAAKAADVMARLADMP